MRGRSLIAALAVPVLLVGAFIVPSALAQDNQVSEEVGDDPNAGATETAVEPGADDQTETATQEAAAPVEATPLVAAIRAKLLDAAIRKDVPAGDLAALEAFYNMRSQPAWMTDMGFSSEAQAIIDEIHEADDWGLSAAAFDVPDAGDLPGSLDEQAAAEIRLDIAILKYARHARGGRADPGRLKNVDMRPALRDPNRVLTEIVEAPEPSEYLHVLHPQHEQFRRLRQALLKARAESEAGAKPRNMQKLIVNMERWRWMPEDIGRLYVQINIPEFMVYIAKNDNVIHQEKVVVGKPVYATPIFSADLKSIVFNPDWTVPSTIVREDLLPRLRKGGGMFGGGGSFLKQHKLTVRYKGKQVDPNSIDWNRVNMGAISFHQAPGPTNVLGKVKFLYPNRHSVYMHDTIKRELLNRDVRVEGHHCPRVANPGKVAAVILAEDRGMPASEIDKLLARGHNSGVALNGRVPVHTTYFTAAADAEGNVRTFADVYSLDAGVAAAIGTDARAETVADNADVRTPEVKPTPPAPRAAASTPKPSTVGPPPPAGFGVAAP